MIDPNRRLATAIFIGSMVMTFVSIYLIQSKILTLVFIILQFCSYIWYVLSYIPFGREMCGGCLKRYIGVNPNETSLL